MAWYTTGTATVTNGSKNVTGVDTLWAIGANAGDSFVLVDANKLPTGGEYEIESVTSNTVIVLRQAYQGTTGSAKSYAIKPSAAEGTTAKLAQLMASFFANYQGLIDMPTTTPTASSIPIADGSGKLAAGWLPGATTSASGVVERRPQQRPRRGRTPCGR
jgi:hypothetical protein